MEDSVLADFIEDEGQRLIFTFDYLTDRSFFIEMKELKTGRNLKDPVCSLSLGKAPAQNIDFEEFEEKSAAKAKAAAAAAADDMGEDFYGTDQYNDDEFDVAGFDEMTFD
jgi:predicted patatin/cPLA2 family phospholipase